MASITKFYNPKTMHIALVVKGDELMEKHLPRRCMVVSVGLILAGMSIPALMALHLLPITFLLGFVGFTLVASGSVMALIFCGEI
jgi:hypothetical protein